MKRVCVLLLLVMLLLLPACSSQAAELQAGWYANPLGIDFFQRLEDYTEVNVGSVTFTTPAGDHGPFRVGVLDTRARTVTVPNTSYGVSPAESLVLPTNLLPSMFYDLTRVDHMEVYWSTNYDASQMMLELWGRTTSQQDYSKMWFQPLSGQRQGLTNLEGGDLRDASFFFRIAVVPEPGAVTCLAAGLSCFVLYAGRRRRAVKAVCVFLILLSIGILLPVGSAQAADLQAGWYAYIDAVHVYSYDDLGQLLLVGGAQFYDTPPGQYGPFTVTDGQYHSWYQRSISVPSSVYGVGSDQSLILPMLLPLSVGQEIAFLEIGIGTNYDSSQMYLQMWRQHLEGGPDELIWERKQSGIGGFSGNIAYDTVYTGPYYFKVNVVPEPSSFIGLLVVAVPVLHIARRRK